MNVNLPDLKACSFVRIQAHFGQVFFYKKKRILRAIKEEHVHWLKALLSCGLIEDLVQQGLFPKTKMSEMSISGYTFVLEHKMLPIQNTFYTWSFEMLKDAAKTTLLVNKIANRYGYELRDGHLSNVMFYYGKCMFIDLDSFVERKNNHQWIAYREFVESYVKLLQLLSLQSNYEFQKSIKGMAHYIPDKLYEATVPKEEQVDRHKEMCYDKLYLLLDKLHLSNSKTIWANYHDDEKKHHGLRVDAIVEIIQKYQPKTIVDLASNSGIIAKKILDNVKSVKDIVCLDKDHTAINKLYLNIGTYHILPMFHDIIPHTNNINLEKPKGELAIALAITHHLLLSGYQYDIHFIFDVIASHTSRYVMIEFMPLGLYAGDIDQTPPLPHWYNDEWFHMNFQEHFELLEKKQTEINRIMYFGKKRYEVANIL